MQIRTKTITCNQNGQIRLPQLFCELLNIKKGTILNAYLSSKAIIFTKDDDVKPEGYEEIGLIKRQVKIGERYLITIPQDFRLALDINKVTILKIKLMSNFLRLSISDNTFEQLQNTIKELGE